MMANRKRAVAINLNDSILTPGGLGSGDGLADNHRMAADSSPLRSGKIIAFVGVADLDRAETFYRDTLGLSLEREDRPFALIFDVQGTMLRVTGVGEVKPVPYTVLGWEVPDIRATVQALQTRGVTTERYKGLQQDELGIWRSPSGGQVAWFKDPDGNTLSVTQF